MKNPAWNSWCTAPLTTSGEAICAFSGPTAKRRKKGHVLAVQGTNEEALQPCVRRGDWESYSFSLVDARGCDSQWPTW